MTLAAHLRGSRPQLLRWAGYGLAAQGVILTLEPLNSLRDRLVVFACAVLGCISVPVLRGWSSRRQNVDSDIDVHLSQLLDDELGRARRNQRKTWWNEDEPPRVLDGFVALWSKRQGRPAQTAGFVVDSGAIEPSSEGLDERTISRPKKKKGALTRVSGLLSDEAMQAHFATIDYETVLAAEHSDRSRPAASLFGVVDWQPWPSMAVTHNVAETSDGFILFTVRGPDVAYFAQHLSTSFEEQVELGEMPDLSVADTVLRGLSEEFGPEVARGASVTLIAIGREVGDQAGRRVRSSMFLSVARLAVDLNGVWRCLADPSSAIDRSEGRGWFGVRFHSLADVNQLLRLYPLSRAPKSPVELRDNGLMKVEVGIFPGTGADPAILGWHPTSRARILLWGEHARAFGRLS